MESRPSDFARALVSLLPLFLCHGCGGGSAPSSVSTRASANAPPTISTATIEEAQVGATFDYQPVVKDPDGDELEFSAVNLPPWASMDPTSGHISGTPGPSDAGVYESISITVADATHEVATAPFSITVNVPLEAGNGVATRSI